MPSTVEGCADRADTRRPNRRAATAARAMPGRWSGRRSRFWVQPLQRDEGVRDRHQGHVVVPALEGAALVVVQAERVLQLPVIVFDGLTGKSWTWARQAAAAGEAGSGVAGCGRAGRGQAAGAR